jgi:ribosome-binding protein aMBF1 (putative translation factor)
MTIDRDFLDEIVEERTSTNPAFPELVQAALNQRLLTHQLAAARRELHISQTKLAAEISTSQSQVARVESGDVDVRLSTISKMAAALGKRIEWSLVDADSETP